MPEQFDVKLVEEAMYGMPPREYRVKTWVSEILKEEG